MIEISGKYGTISTKPSFVITDAILEKFGGDTVLQLKSHIKVSGKY